MDPVLSPSLLQAAAEVASGPIAREVSRRTVRLRVSWTVARGARKRCIQITSAALRRWLVRSDVQDQLRLGTAATVVTAVGNLVWLLPGDEEQRNRDAPTVFFLVLAAFLRAQDAASATAVAHEWQVEHTRAQGRATQEAIQATEASILDRLSTSQIFNEQVRSLHPWRRDQAIAIRSSWPTIELVVNAITTAEDPGALLQQWAEQPTDWYAEAPAEVLCWLADMAADAGQRNAAAQLVAAGLDRGAFPAAYWQARRAIYLVKDNPSDTERILESASDQHPLARCLLAWHRQSWQEAIESLSAWNPDFVWDRAMKTRIQAQLAVGAGDLNRGVTLALRAAEIEHATEAAVLAADLLLSRARHGETVHRLADAEQAAALAIRARNARRTWKGDSVAAVQVAVKAAALGGNLVRAWASPSHRPKGRRLSRRQPTHSCAGRPPAWPP